MSISANQIKLLFVARGKLGFDDDTFRSALAQIAVAGAELLLKRLPGFRLLFGAVSEHGIVRAPGLLALLRDRGGHVFGNFGEGRADLRRRIDLLGDAIGGHRPLRNPLEGTANQGFAGEGRDCRVEGRCEFPVPARGLIPAAFHHREVGFSFGVAHRVHRLLIECGNLLRPAGGRKDHNHQREDHCHS